MIDLFVENKKMVMIDKTTGNWLHNS